MTEAARITALFAATALIEIVGCWLVWLVVRGGQGLWLLLPATLALAAFAWLLTLHPAATGRVYAAYGGVYVAMALVWLRVVDGVTLTRWDIAGSMLALGGMLMIALQPRG